MHTCNSELRSDMQVALVQLAARGTRVCASPKPANSHDGMQDAVRLRCSPHRMGTCETFAEELSTLLSDAGLTKCVTAQVPWETQACRALQVRVKP